MSETPEGHMMQHLCACVIDLAGEGFTTVERSLENEPVPWPEIAVLQSIHGDDAIYNIYPIALVPRETPAREKERLVLKYGRDAVEQVYAGRGFHMEFFMPGWPIDPRKVKKIPNERPKPAKYKAPDAEAGDFRV